MRVRLSILLMVLSVFIADRSSAQQQLYGSRQEASKLTKQDMPELARRAEAGDAQAQLLLGHAYRYGYGTGRKESDGVKWYQKSADQGNADAQYFLAYAYQFGNGVAKNENEAMKWYLRAAEQGQIDAQVNLGGIYHRQKNYTEAEKWDRKAAEAGDAVGQANLSKDYALGDVLPQDYPAAYMWILLARAARCGEPPKRCVELDPGFNVDSMGLRNSIAEHLSPEQITEARNKASEWLVAHQKEPLPPEGTDNIGAMFLVAHKHGGSGFMARALTGGLSEAFDRCHGWITISKDQIKYASEDGKCAFEARPSEVKKVGTSARFQGGILLVDVNLALTDGKKHTLVLVDNQGQRQDPGPLVEALKTATGK